MSQNFVGRILERTRLTLHVGHVCWHVSILIGEDEGLIVDQTAKSGETFIQNSIEKNEKTINYYDFNKTKTSVRDRNLIEDTIRSYFHFQIEQTML